jgi:intracellular septation protein A
MRRRSLTPKVRADAEQPVMQARGLLVNLCFNVVLPLIAVNVLEARGVGIVTALAISAVFPALETGATWIRLRRLDTLGAISLAFITLGVGASLVSGDVHFALAKESFFSGVFGLICLGSLLAPRPLMFFLGRTFSTGGDPARETLWNERWAVAGFRNVIRRMTFVWGVAYVSEAALRIVLVYALPVNAALVVSPTLAMAVTAALVFWTIRYGRNAERRGAELRAKAEADAAAL